VFGGDMINATKGVAEPVVSMGRIVEVVDENGAKRLYTSANTAIR
jgi:hypothetical protein